MNTSDAESLSSSIAALSPPGGDEASGAAETERWESFETRLSAQLAELARLCADDSALPDHDNPPSLPLRQQARSLTELHAELKAAQQRWRVQYEWREREHQALRQQLDAEQRQLIADRAALLAQEALLSQHQQKLDHALRYASQQQTELDAQRLRLRAQRRRAGATLAQRREELRRQLQEFHDALAASGGAAPVPDSQVEALLRERDELQQRLAQAEASAVAVGGNENAVGGNEKEENDKAYELRRRFEMAVEDMRAYKHRVEELEQQLAQRPDQPRPAPSGGLLDWAQQKAQMLASLETDLAGTDPKSIESRLTAEGAIRITDDVVAAKEAEIKELQRQLEDVRTERKSAAAQDVAMADMLDHDTLIATERERLRKLQESCLEKQRTAEVEISLERARLARQRVEMEDRLHALETDLARRQAAGSFANDETTPRQRNRRAAAG